MRDRRPYWRRRWDLWPWGVLLGLLFGVLLLVVEALGGRLF